MSDVRADKIGAEPRRSRSLKYGNTYVTIVLVLDIRAYIDLTGRSPFQAWFADLDSTAAAKVTVGLARLEQGNLSNDIESARERWIDYKQRRKTER